MTDQSYHFADQSYQFAGGTGVRLLIQTCTPSTCFFTEW